MFEKSILPSIEVMFKDDPAPEVRGKASSALLEIKEQIVKQGDDFFRAKITIPTVTSEAAGIEMHHARSQCLRASSKSS